MRSWLVFGLVGSLAACHENDAPVQLSAVQPLSAPTTVGTAPMFAVSSSAQEAAAWVSAPAGGIDGRLYVSLNGTAPIELRDSLGPIEAHGESPPKIAFGSDGALNAIYVVAKVVPGKRFPLAALRFIRSTDGGKNWSAPVTVTDDSTFGSHNFHSLHVAQDGAIYTAWLDGREGKSAAYVARSNDHGQTWSSNHRIATGEACPCCRTALATSDDGTLYAAWRSVVGHVRDIVIVRSSDHGDTFTTPQRVHADDWQFDGCPHAGPSIQVDSRNRLHVAWWTGKDGAAGVYYARSDDGGRTFGDAVPLGVAKFSRAAHVQLALASDDKVIVVWDDGTLASSQIKMRISRDGGDHFAEAEPVSAGDRAAGFPVLAVSSHGIAVAWSEKSVASAEREMKAMPDMKNPHSVMGLNPVGDAQVMVRRGVL